MVKIRKLGIIGSTYRHAGRYRQILGILLKYGFGDLVERLHLDHYIEFSRYLLTRERRAVIETMTRAERVRCALAELGPTFIKMGQILSTRPDLVSPELVRELELLQENVPPFAFVEVRTIVETELGRPLHEIYDAFEEAPIAAASIGQVHRAVLRKTGEVVAVKVQRPGIQEMIAIDVEIMLHLAELAENYLDPWELHRPTEIVARIAESLDSELDYQTEAAHMVRFRAQFAKDRRVAVPQVHEKLTTRRVLTMSYMEGIRVTDVDRIRLYALDPRKIARRGAQLMMRQIFEFGYFHADPHPGNILVQPGHMILFLDFGMMGCLDARTRGLIADLVYAASRRNDLGVANAILSLTEHDHDPDPNVLAREIGVLLDRHLYRPVKDTRIGLLLHDIFALAARHRIRIPANLVFMIKALGTAESLARHLDPHFNMIRAARPYLEKIQRRRYHPVHVAAETLRAGIGFVELLRDLPGEIRVLLDKAKAGHVKIEFEHKGLEPVMDTLDRMSNILSFAIVQGSLVVGSSIVILSGIPPRWNGIPLIGVGGFVVAGMMGFRYLISLYRSGKM